MTMALLNVFGGLAIFIFGMKLMSDGLQKAAGERMRSVLRLFASNRLVAILSGTAVTAVIQSSSATTVMVIGFVNAGLLTLLQSIGIIFGANIGTTVTAQLVAFDVAWMIMPAIILGVLLSFVASNKARGWDETIVGFGFLFLGMSLMSEELKVLSGHPGFSELFRTFNCTPVNGHIPFGALLGAIGIGLGATLIIQSSSACTGIIIALGSGGLIDLYTAVALVLGSNIGTTVTAQLAAIVANRIAKQAALAHTLFNVIGTLLIVATFWWTPVEGGAPAFFELVNFFSGDGDLPRRIANAHTIFNVCTTLVLTPFIPLLAHICETIIPVRSPKVKYRLLEPNLLDTPSIALSQTTAALRRMLRRAWKMTDRALGCCCRGGGAEVTDALTRRMETREERVDASQREITDYLSELMRRQLSPTQAGAIPKLLHCTNDAERIGDHAGIILELSRQFRDAGGKLGNAAEEELSALLSLLREQARSTLAVLETASGAECRRGAGLEEQLTRLAATFEENHLHRLAAGKCRPVGGVFYVELLDEFRKISRHLGNITDRAAEFSPAAASVDHERKSGA